VAATLLVGGKSIAKHLAAVVFWLGYLATDVGGIEVVLAANIAKLEARHPAGFNSDYVKEQTS